MGKAFRRHGFFSSTTQCLSYRLYLRYQSVQYEKSRSEEQNRSCQGPTLFQEV